MNHIPVLLDFIDDNLLFDKDSLVVDATLGEGGHTERFLSRGKRVVAFERDEAILRLATKRLKPYEGRLEGHNANFSKAETILPKSMKSTANLVLFDLGIATSHYKTTGRGFGFLDGESLDMRLDDEGQSVQEIVNAASEEALVSIFQRYGELRFAKRIARQIVERRQARLFEAASDLAVFVASKTPKRQPKGRGEGRFRRIHPATQVFQALRIEANNELVHLRLGLRALLPFLAPGGRFVVISYHSLEDRIVKDMFSELAGPKINLNKYRESKDNHKGKNRYQLFSRKPIVPSEAEILKNPSARSAKMRVLLKV